MLVKKKQTNKTLFIRAFCNTTRTHARILPHAHTHTHIHSQRQADSALLLRVDEIHKLVMERHMVLSYAAVIQLQSSPYMYGEDRTLESGQLNAKPRGPREIVAMCYVFGRLSTLYSQFPFAGAIYSFQIILSAHVVGAR